MKHVVLVATLVASLSAAAVVSGQTAPTTGSSLGSVTLAKRVMADGQPLAAGTYQVRLSADVPKPGCARRRTRRARSDASRGSHSTPAARSAFVRAFERLDLWLFG